MLLNKSNLQGKKVVIGGIQGEGKTYLAKAVSSLFRSIVVYTPNADDKLNYWAKGNNIIINTPDYAGDFDFWLAKFIVWAKANKIDLLIIDDADNYFENNFVKSANLREIWANHRHYGKNGLTILIITHRLTDITRRIYGQVEFIAMFRIEDNTTINILNDISEGYGDLVKSLNKHEFALKPLGQQPVRMKV